MIMVDNLIEWIEGDTPPEMNDSDRLDFLEENQGCALVSDLDGQWAVYPAETEIFFIEITAWRPTIREAIDAFREEQNA